MQNSKTSLNTRRQILQGSVASFGLGFSCALGGNAQAARAQRNYTDPKFRLGVNLAGAEFEAIGGHWKWPTEENLSYYLNNGFTIFRVPFRWERIQPELRGPLSATALSGLDGLIHAANAMGAVTILDAHGYGRRKGDVIGGYGSPVTAGDFADFWGRMGDRYKLNQLVWYNLMNEPHNEPAEVNLNCQNAACNAIRKSGARSKVLFSGTAWTGGHSWIKSGNGEVMLRAIDHENNYAFDIHQYLDLGFGGSSAVLSKGSGSTSLTAVTQWAKYNNKKLFLGEFGCPPSLPFLAELDSLITHVINNRDVFLGATYFAGGGSWGNGVGSSDPIGGDEKPQTLLLKKYLTLLHNR
ncbi:glycoside hydrolase family 5 protein [Sphingomonas sp. NFX23]|uniref:glycoside hydrolase family 5 protein n=1 Tax=Sphingomonas sp. NFX23 TaxID=2819532 RepID=UPI003CF47B4F